MSPARAGGDLSDAVVLVTGGASGIGRAVARLAAERGARVGVLDLDAAGATGVVAEIEAAGHGPALAVECDVTSALGVDTAFAAAQTRLGPLTGLFTAAGIDLGGFAHELSPATWERVLATNLTGTFLACQQGVRSLLQSGLAGSIVACSSPAASVGYPAGGASAYAASKGGVSALVRTLAVDYARHGIRVNAVVPGATETPLMWANVVPTERASLRARINDEIPLGRIADPEEPARAVLWLLSRESSYVTGSHLVCDGGILAKASMTS